MAQKQTRPTRRAADALPPIPSEKDRIRTAFQTYRLMADIGPADWPDSTDLRDIAARLGVPYMLLLLDYYATVTPRVVTPEDLAEWSASPAAQWVLDVAWVGDRIAKAQKAVA